MVATTDECVMEAASVDQIWDERTARSRSCAVNGWDGVRHELVNCRPIRNQIPQLAEFLVPKRMAGTERYPFPPPQPKPNSSVGDRSFLACGFPSLLVVPTMAADPAPGPVPDPVPVPVPVPQSAQIDETEQKRLRYLEFVHAAAVQVVLWAAWLYGFAKERAGPLTPVVLASEGAVRALVGPVYDKYHAVPFELLKFIDQKVGESVHKLEPRVPSVVVEASAAARYAACEVRRAGLVGSAVGLARSVYCRCEPTAKGVYAKYKPAAEQVAVSAWRLLSRLPLVIRLVVPATVHLSEKYNEAVRCSAMKGYSISAHLPLVPTERIVQFLAGKATVKSL
ncbi:REF SRPP-like protein [Musa troglodytarum]|uniref:REF SRPP-like protein n=1 Tax=Musa troglodytarum TaxID=320322 RepID=A0A9E7GKE1_9LILI|nr:REF SRPP-like protein [Musa troglodytarum]